MITEVFRLLTTYIIQYYIEFQMLEPEKKSSRTILYYKRINHYKIIYAAAVRCPRCNGYNIIYLFQISIDIYNTCYYIICRTCSEKSAAAHAQGEIHVDRIYEWKRRPRRRPPHYYYNTILYIYKCMHIQIYYYYYILYNQYYIELWPLL